MAKKRGLIRFLLISMLAALTAGGAVYGMRKGADVFANSSYFKVKTVNVRGLIKADSHKVQKMVRTMVGKSIFDIDTANINYQEDSWVERMEIRKVFPDKLDIVVFEKIPVFKLRNTKGCFTATSTGLLIKDNCQGVRVKMDQRLNNDDLKQFIGIYQEAGFLKNKFISLKPYYFTMKDGDTQLMAGYSKDDFDRLYKTYQSVVKKRYQTIEYVDMRVPDKIFVKGVM